MEGAAFGLHAKRTTPIVRNSTDHMGASTGSMVFAKVPIRWSRNPGIGSGKRSRTIPQIAKPMTPNEMNAIPEAFRMAAIVTIAHIVVNWFTLIFPWSNGF